VVNVELPVSGLNEQPMADTKLQVKVFEPQSLGPAPYETTVVTDDHGVVRFLAPAGVFRISASVSGVGYGAAGLTEYSAARMAHLRTLKLIVYGNIEGTYPADACRGDVTIRTSRAEKLSMTPVTAGNFRFSDIPYGEWQIWATTGEKTCAVLLGPTLIVEPGRTLSGVDLKPLPALPGTPDAKPGATNRSHEKQKAVWVRGVVRNVAGQAVHGASVMAALTFRRQGHETDQTTTDRDGRYELARENWNDVTATLIAIAPGYGPTWAWPDFPEDSNPRVQDLVLPSESGSLQVTVVSGGKPVGGITVAAYLQGANLSDAWGAPAADSSAIEEAAYPVRRTNSDGVAVLIGCYRANIVLSPQTICKASVPPSRHFSAGRDSKRREPGFRFRLEERPAID
jgi:hypothetical protein